MKNKSHDFLTDYQEFIESEQIVPNELNDKVLFKVSQLISPNAWMVFLKLLGVHFVMGFLSLSFCHQFGLNPFRTQRSLADWFMEVGGHHICMLLCGLLFLSLSIFAAGYLFTTEEVRSLKQHELLQNFSLGVISLGLFAAFGAEIALGLAVLWLIGGFVGGLLALAAVFQIRTALNSNVSAQ